MRRAKQKGYTPPPPKTNEAPPNTDPNDLKTDYPDLFDANKDEEEITITHEGLTGTLIFDGFQKLKKINVGNNCLEYLVVENCPELTTLRYAYNQMKHDAFIDWDSCSKLTTIDKHGYDGSVPWDEGNKSEDKKEEFNEKPTHEKNSESPKKPTEEIVVKNDNQVNFPFYLIPILPLFCFAFIKIGLSLILSKKKKNSNFLEVNGKIIYHCQK
ncbi:MAG: hypothetical protein mread185_000368 [Mycoplasmataceae bacterium]|nr:MAG: hypothetical protein mread185_000368 [Mycoplasmataceae bacterium]